MSGAGRVLIVILFKIEEGYKTPQYTGGLVLLGVLAGVPLRLGVGAALLAVLDTGGGEGGVREPQPQRRNPRPSQSSPTTHPCPPAIWSRCSSALLTATATGMKRDCASPCGYLIA